MMDKDKLRKADIFSGSIIFLAGAFIVSQALKMPMKDSWGGVQNVWYVSPAIFPLFVGAMIMLLGGLLVRTAIKEVGLIAIRQVGEFILSSEFLVFLKQKENIRFYGILTLLLSFIFLFIPRVDFFLTAIDFLLAFILWFYLDRIDLLKKMLGFYLIQILIFSLLFVTGLNGILSELTTYPADLLKLCFILGLGVYGYILCKNDLELMRKFKISVTVALVAPFTIGIIFKYILLVPMPFEGMVIGMVDAIWYR